MISKFPGKSWEFKIFDYLVVKKLTSPLTQKCFVGGLFNKLPDELTYANQDALRGFSNWYEDFFFASVVDKMFQCAF